MKQYIVDAFTDKLFAGNPAAVCVMEQWPADELMQSIAIENNFSETAFTVREPDAHIVCAGSRRAARSTSAATRRWGRPLSSSII